MDAGRRGTTTSWGRDRKCKDHTYRPRPLGNIPSASIGSCSRTFPGLWGEGEGWEGWRGEGEGEGERRGRREEANVKRREEHTYYCVPSSYLVRSSQIASNFLRRPGILSSSLELR